MVYWLWRQSIQKEIYPIIISHQSIWLIGLGKSLEILAEYLNTEIIEYEQYFMEQLSEIYLDRLLSRTPEEYKNKIMETKDLLPDVIKIPA